MDETTEEIRRRADIVEIVEGYISLKPAGNNRWKACCPFHDEKTPSFYVSRDKGFYKCFGCGAAGDIFKFVQQIENVDFLEARRTLAEKTGVPIRSQRDYTPEQQQVFAQRDRLLRVTETAAKWFEEQLSSPDGADARDYARSRLAPATMRAFNIGYALDAWDACRNFLVKKYGFSEDDGVAAGLLIEKHNDDGSKRTYDRYRHRLMFPIWDERGRVIAFGGRALEGGKTGTPEAKYINSPEGVLFKKSHTLYGWHLARPEVGRRESIIISEGYMDAIALHAAGFSNTVATLGTSLTDGHAQMLKRLAPKTVYLCFDGDGAGMKAALRAGPLFDAHDLAVKIVALPDGHDPDTFLREMGTAAFEKLLDEARLLAQYRVERAIGDFHFEHISDRAEALQEAASIIAAVPGASEQEAYIAFLAEKWARQENVVDAGRLQMIEAAVRRQVKAAARQNEQDRRNQNRRDQERFQFKRAQEERAQNEDNDADLSAQLDTLAGEKAETKPAWQPKKKAWQPNWQPNSGPWRGAWRDGLRRDGDGVPEAAHNADAEADAIDEVVAQTLSSVAGANAGATRTERLLLGVMLNAPSQRARVLAALPGALWTSEIHYEIVAHLKTLPADEPVDPPRLLEELSPEAGGLVGELLLGDEAETPATLEVIDDCIARIENFHARQREQEILSMIRGKIERGESVTAEERTALLQATIESGRREKPEA